MRKLRPAQAIHDEAVNAQKLIWREFEDFVAGEIENHKIRGRFIARIKVPADVMDATPMIALLKEQGYTCHLSKNDDSGESIILSWRVPKEVA